MRCYHFGNFYLSSIQQGIQAAHAQMELFVKYSDNLVPGYTSIQKQNLFDWAKNHKTMVCLNGWALKDLKNIEVLMKDSENKYPWSAFYEDEYSLGAILTNITIVLPEEIYDTAAKIRSGEYLLCNNVVLEKPTTEFLTFGVCPALQTPNKVMTLTDFDKKLIDLLNSCQLAR